ncbi:MAG: hypothetical protein LBD29_01275 [Treponema sp.]|jgi:hypothetical protein|nr:hypothetical protein [Treponema sp.]
MDDKEPDSKPQNETSRIDLSEASLDRELVFYYSRERRLAKASPKLRAFIEGCPQKRPPVLGGLTATKAHTVLLIMIIVLSLFISIASIVSGGNKEKNAVKLEGNSIYLSAQPIEETSYLTIRKVVRNDEAIYTGPVDVAISLEAAKNGSASENLPIETHRIFFTSKPEEEFGLSIPFRGSVLVVIMQTENDNQKIFKVKLK